MQKSFYRKTKGQLAGLFCAGVVGVAMLVVASPVQAFDQFSEALLAAPAANAPAAVQPVAFVLPVSPDTRPPTPIRKPDGRAVVLKTGVTPAAGIIQKAVGRGDTAAALRFLNNPGVARHLSVVEYDRLRAKVAAGYLSDNDIQNALALAKASHTRSGAAVPMAGWITGLAAWRSGDYQTALSGFSSVARAKDADEWLRAGGAFWAARAARKVGNRSLADVYLTVAGQYDRTFYGLLARTAQGRAPDLNWDIPAFAAAHEELLSRHPLAQAAFNHVAAGRITAADEILMQIARDGDEQVKLAALGYATRAGLPATALKLARTIEHETGLRYDAAYYPLGGWIEVQDYTIDRALVHAIIRQESSFNPRARSHQGAVGLMQLMPSTANYVARVMNVNARAGDLTSTQSNLDVGQNYLQYLLEADGVDGDLLSLLVAYNAGPGNLVKWQKRMPDAASDPLLFIESIPSPETRGYVEKVMASYWIYRDRLGQANPTLTALADGQAIAYAEKPPATWAETLKISAIWP